MQTVREPTCIVYMVRNKHSFDETADACNVNTEVFFSDGSNKYQDIELQLEYSLPVSKLVS